jgi:hypothetical protein
MKFDALTFQYLEEANVGSRGGHISIEEALKNLDTENTIQNFIQTSDPRFLIYPLVVSSDFNHKDKKIKIGPAHLSGMAFVSKVKDVFFNQSSPNYINIPRTKDGQIPTQQQLLGFAKKVGQAQREGNQAFLTTYKDFSKTPQQYVEWGQLLTLVFSSSEFKESDRRQEVENEAKYATYTNTEGVETEYRFHTDPQNVITGSPFSSSVEFDRPHVKPEAVSDMTYGQFVNRLRDSGNTFDALLELINGAEGRAKKAKRPSLIELMKQKQQGNK